MFNKSKIIAVMLASSSSFALAGTMGGVHTGTNLLIEAGGVYSHYFYKNDVVSPENGFVYQPDDYFPSNFGGGYIGLSLQRSDWLFNMRYDMYALASKSSNVTNTTVKTAPEKLVFSLDKIMHSQMPFDYGFGGGVVLSTFNKAQITYITSGIDASVGTTFQGRLRMSPLVEALGIYKVTDRVNLKLNVAYHIPVYDTYRNGTLDTSLGMNYSFPL